jgi:hypothetical protein
MTWIKRLAALLLGGVRPGKPLRTDWRGRPVDKSNGNANSPVSFPHRRRPATLYPSFIARESDPSNAGDYQSRIC